MNLSSLRSLFTGHGPRPAGPAAAADPAKSAAAASRPRQAGAVPPALAARRGEPPAQPAERPSPQPSLRRQNAVVPDRGPAAVRSDRIDLPKGTQGPLVQLMSPPAGQELPAGTRGTLAALMHHDARSEAIQAAQALAVRGSGDGAAAPPAGGTDAIGYVPAEGSGRAATAGPVAADGPPVPDAPDTPAQAPPSSRRSKDKIDKKIDLVRQPDTHVSELPPAQMSALAQALGLPGPPAEALSDPQAAASTARAVAHRLQGLQLGDVFTKYDSVRERQRIKNSALVQGASSEQRRALQDLAVKTHLWLREHETVDPVTQRSKVEVSIYFDGIPERAENQVKRVVQGGIGDVYRSACQAGQLVADILAAKAASAAGPDVEIVHVCGLSVGGGSAQMFNTALQGRIALDTPPSLVLLDPALISKAQARHAAKGALRVPPRRPAHGLIITLDYDKKPRRSLVDSLYYLGYRSEGLVRLALGLRDDDGLGSQPPKPSDARVIGTFLGYHSNRHHYDNALRRFAGPAPSAS